MRARPRTRQTAQPKPGWRERRGTGSIAVRAGHAPGTRWRHRRQSRRRPKPEPQEALQAQHRPAVQVVTTRRGRVHAPPPASQGNRPQTNRRRRQRAASRSTCPRAGDRPAPRVHARLSYRRHRRPPARSPLTHRGQPELSHSDDAPSPNRQWCGYTVLAIVLAVAQDMGFRSGAPKSSTGPRRRQMRGQVRGWPCLISRVRSASVSRRQVGSS